MFLRSDEDFRDHTGTRGRETDEQYEAECEALAAPWSELCATTPDLCLWRVAERRIALGVAGKGSRPTR